MIDPKNGLASSLAAQILGADPGTSSLNDSEVRLRAVLDATLDAVISIDDAGLILSWNRQAAEMFGWRADEAIGRRLSELIIPPKLRDAHESGHDRLRRTGVGPILNKRVEVTALRRDGVVLPVELLVVPVTVGQRKTYFGFLHDISERKEAERKLREAHDDLERRVEERTRELREEVVARIRAQELAEQHRRELVQSEKLVALGTLTSGVAHEINNPNQFILLNLPLLADAFADALPILEKEAQTNPGLRLGGLSWDKARTEIPAMINDIRKGAERIRRIVSELRDYARQHSAASMRPTDLNDVVRSALTLLSSPIRKACADFASELAEDLPLVRAHPGRLEQVAINLILNACEALRSPSGQVRVRTLSEPGDGDSGPAAVLEVSDTGCGISPEALDRITDPFFTTKRDSGGTGLGLAIASRIVAEHGGTLTYQSTVGKGTTARLRLPTMANIVATPPVHTEGAS